MEKLELKVVELSLISGKNTSSCKPPGSHKFADRSFSKNCFCGLGGDPWYIRGVHMLHTLHFVTSLVNIPYGSDSNAINSTENQSAFIIKNSTSAVINGRLK